MRIAIFLFSCFVCFSNLCRGQGESPAWDNAVNKQWGSEFSVIQIKSSIDSTLQRCRFYRSRSSAPQPLVISLHTWSGDYNQEDPLAKEVLLRGWNYIHPDFRGPNDHPDACGSPLVISDLEDVIKYVTENASVDTSNIHIIGVSGGGYTTLMAYMKLNYPVKSFNAWAAISDLRNWYWESLGRKARYASDLEKVATDENGFHIDELVQRSPMHLPYPSGLRSNASLNIYTGVHDGYTGSVPISHSVHFFNKVVEKRFPGQPDKKVADSTWVSILVRRTNPYPDTSLVLGGRKIHLLKELPGVRLALFEGGHEMIVPQALTLAPIDGNKNMKPLNVLTIGDSNGAFDFGWPRQLMKLLPYSRLINRSVAGNTIGFDNLGQKKLNTLANIDDYLDSAYQALGDGEKLDYLFIGLGTNDAKVIFRDKQKEVAKNLAVLLGKIRSYHVRSQRALPRICVITPPPMEEQKVEKGKYGSGDRRIRNNNEKFKLIAKRGNADFLDTYTLLKEGFSHKTEDGIHLNEKAQFELASIILSYINQADQP